MEKSKVKCPKCKSNDLLLTEVWYGSTITWEQFKGEFDKKNGILEPGDAAKVQACCYKCDHRWTVRGVKQITEIIID
jgi:RNA polymerase subunit RPABC4/transcription elongation factor Spt4